MDAPALEFYVPIARKIQFLKGPETGSYKQDAVVSPPHVIRSLDISIRTSLVKYEKVGCYSDKAILLYMGGPCENRSAFSGLPSAICEATGHTVFSVAYLGSIQDPARTEGTAADAAELLDGTTGKMNWKRMGEEILSLLREFVRPNYHIVGTICHSFGVIPAVSVALQAIATGCPLSRPMMGNIFIAIEPYLPARDTGLRVVLSEADLEKYGYPLDGPFQFGEPRVEPGPTFTYTLSQFLNAGAVRHRYLLLAGGYRSCMSKEIADQVTTTYKGFPVEMLPNCNHGMNLKNVVLGEWKLSEEEVVLALAGLLQKVCDPFK